VGSASSISAPLAKGRLGHVRLAIPAPDLQNMNCRLVERVARVDRHDLKRLAADYDLIVRPGPKAHVLAGPQAITEGNAACQQEAAGQVRRFGKTVQSFRAIFLLAREGYSYEVMEPLRGIRESLDLVHLFLDEGDDTPNLKWFAPSGAITLFLVAFVQFRQLALLQNKHFFNAQRARDNEPIQILSKEYRSLKRRSFGAG
jgi:hypothetical protein